MAVTNYATLNGQLVGETGPNGTMYYHTDALGSVTMTTGPTAGVLNTYRYKPYGVQLSKSGSSPDPKFAWVGSRGYRAESTIHSEYYMRSRHYGLTEGRWTAQDGLWPDLCAYCYVNGKVQLFADPSGYAGGPPGFPVKPLCDNLCYGSSVTYCEQKNVPFYCCISEYRPTGEGCSAYCGESCPKPVPTSVCRKQGFKDLLGYAKEYGKCKYKGSSSVKSNLPGCKGSHITYKYCCGEEPVVYSIDVCGCRSGPCPGEITTTCEYYDSHTSTKAYHCP